MNDMETYRKCEQIQTNEFEQRTNRNTTTPYVMIFDDLRPLDSLDETNGCERMMIDYLDETCS